MGWLDNMKAVPKPAEPTKEEVRAQREQERQDKRLEKAKALIEDIVALQKRWGKHGGLGAHHPDQVLDALVVVHEGGYLGRGDDAAELRAALTLANRQLGASKAREIKLKSRIKELEG